MATQNNRNNDRNNGNKPVDTRITGTSLKFQRKVAQAVAKARHLALMPYVTDALK